MYDTLCRLRAEYVVTLSGTVRARSSVNDRIPTGRVEVCNASAFRLFPTPPSLCCVVCAMASFAHCSLRTELLEFRCRVETGVRRRASRVGSARQLASPPASSQLRHMRQSKQKHSQLLQLQKLDPTCTDG